MRSLGARVTFVTIAVAVIAVVITGVISLQLVRSSKTDDVRSQLSGQADLLAKLPNITSAAELADKASFALSGTEVALVQPGGAANGAAAQYLDRALLSRIAKGQSVSVSREGVMIETRPAGGGRTVVLALPLARIDQELSRATGRILIALAIGLLIAILGGTLLARLLSRPLTETAAAARRLAAGERGVSMPRNSTREVADVAEALAALDTALAASEGRQREFLISISHELRTPLTAVRGYAEAMADGLVTSDRIQAVGETLVAETERLDRFVGDLLELSRLEADDFSITRSLVVIPTLLDELVAAWSGRASTLGVSFTAHAAAVTVTTDPRRLRQVIDGLVENAMRVTPAGSTVCAKAAADRSGVLIEVLDGGPGLAPDDLAVAFERGVLHGRYRDIRPIGTGLGLSIASRLVERLGGTISVANRPEGGAVFSVRLP